MTRETRMNTEIGKDEKLGEMNIRQIMERQRRFNPKREKTRSKGDKLESPKVEKKILNLESRMHLQTRVFVYFGHLTQEQMC